MKIMVIDDSLTVRTTGLSGIELLERVCEIGVT
jgi:hypothetical protein